VHDFDAAGLARRLAGSVRGDVRFDAKARALYAGDASNYRVPPAGVVLPRTVDDVIATVALCDEFGAPITQRGAGTSVVGNAVGPGVVIDNSRYLNAILDVDPSTRRAIVEPGVVLDDLQRAAARHGLRFGPDPSSRSRCTVGGMIGNNACGARSVAWGTTAGSTRTVDVLTVNGTRFTAGPMAEHSPPIALAATLHDFVHGHLALIRTALPDWPRRVSGYALQHLLPEHGSHLARALVGTEGSCVTVLGAELDLVPAPRAVALAVLGYRDAPTAADAVPALLAAFAPPGLPSDAADSPSTVDAPTMVASTTSLLAIEGIDAGLVAALRARGRRPAVALPAGAAWLLVEIAGADPTDAGNRARALAADSGRPALVLVDPAQQRAVWKIREDGAGLATRTADGGEAWPGWEDAAVPPARLGGYLREFDALCRRHGRRGTVYGHFGDGCVHVRLDFDLQSPNGLRGYRRFVEDAAALVTAHGGSLSGEHGDGRARGELLDRMYPSSVLRLFERFKRIFDDDGLMNPGIGVRPVPLDANLRLSPSPPPVFLGLPADGGDLSRAVRRCVGVGSCRRTDGVGVMCPSYAVTHDEQHSTRGRTRLLGEMLDGRLIRGGWRSHEVAEALDLCLACKGCRSDCPVSVDMATYKAEFLYQHYRGRPRPRDLRVLGGLPRLMRSATGRLAVRIAAGSPALGRAAARLAGVTTQRPLPVPARETLRRWLRRRGEPLGVPPRGTVLLWPDTFTNAFDPHVGQAAVELLESVGFRVQVPSRPVCCGLTYFATGQLPAARRVLSRSLDVIKPFLDAGVPIVGLEPSCTAALRGDAAELLPDDGRVAALRDSVHTLAELLAARAPDWTPRRAAPGTRAVVQTHCHQHAVLGAAADAALLAKAGVEVVEHPSGCCGLAGSFGYQRGHESLSTALAGRALLPAIHRAGPDALLLADGFSCRLQARHHSTAHPLHLAELLAPLA
jgi:FAD/FMN-containing dehydrogenase/Fe-S oxidoreductase